MKQSPKAPHLEVPSLFAASVAAWDLPATSSKGVAKPARRARPKASPAPAAHRQMQRRAVPARMAPRAAGPYASMQRPMMKAEDLSKRIQTKAPVAGAGLSTDERFAEAKKDNWKLLGIAGFFGLWIVAVLFFLFRYVAI